MLLWLHVSATIVALSYGNPLPDKPDCLSVNQTKLFCLTNSPVSLSLSCPALFDVKVLSTNVYQTPPGTLDNCPSSHDPMNQRCQEVTNSSISCNGTRCELSVSVLSSDGDLCNAIGQESTDKKSNGRYVFVVFRCEPHFSQFLNGTATAIAIDDNSTVSNSLIAINSNVLGLTGIYITQTSSFCSAIIPRNSEVVVSTFFMLAKPKSSYSGNSQDNQCVNVVMKDGIINDDSKVISSFCWSSNMTKVPLVFGCSPNDRFLKISYTNSDPNMSIIFVIHLQVSYMSKITIQCGSPTFPLMLPTTSTAPGNFEIPVVDSATTTSESDAKGILIIGVSCGLGGLAVLLVIVIVTAFVCHRSRRQSVPHQPLSETSSINSISEIKHEFAESAKSVIPAEVKEMSLDPSINAISEIRQYNAHVKE